MRLLPLALLAALPALTAHAGKPAAPGLDGVWETPAGRVELKRTADKVAGVLVEPAPASKLPKGTSVLTGTFFEDNLSADLRAAVLAPEACGEGKETAFVLLLLTKKGKLTGGVSTKAKCAADRSTATFVRAGAGAGPAREKKMLGDQAPEGTYDPRGHRSAPLVDSVRGLMEQAQEQLAEGRFEQARKLFQQALQKDPKLGEAYNGVGVTYYARNAFEDAIDWYKRGLEAAPGFGDLYYNLACGYALVGKKTHALRYLKLAAAKGFTEVAALDEDHDLDTLREEPEFKAIRELMDAPPAPLPPP